MIRRGKMRASQVGYLCLWRSYTSAPSLACSFNNDRAGRRRHQHSGANNWPRSYSRQLGPTVRSGYG